MHFMNPTFFEIDQSPFLNTQMNLVRLPQFQGYGLTNSSNWSKVDRVFTEKTLPTSMVIAMITWGLITPRVSQELHKRSCEMLTDIIKACTYTGKFHVTVFPDWSPGTFVDMISKCPKLFDFSLILVWVLQVCLVDVFHMIDVKICAKVKMCNGYSHKLGSLCAQECLSWPSLIAQGFFFLWCGFFQQVMLTGSVSRKFGRLSWMLLDCNYDSFQSLEISLMYVFVLSRFQTVTPSVTSDDMMSWLLKYY